MSISPRITVSSSPECLTKLLFDAAENYQAKARRGAEATIASHVYFVGNHRFAHERGICSEKLETILVEIEIDAKSVVVVGHRPHSNCQGEVLGILSVGDVIRPNAAEAVRLLHDAGIRKVVMLSGDNVRTANAIAKQVGIDEVQGDLLPEQKIDHVRKLAADFRSVGLIGDGVNDAPAIAVANVGTAIGAAATDTAIETADVALMRDDLLMVAEAIRLGRRTLGVIRFNIAFAVGLKLSSFSSRCSAKRVFGWRSSPIQERPFSLFSTRFGSCADKSLLKIEGAGQ
jgi:Cd2+/Zn2+-exporting ATPase